MSSQIGTPGWHCNCLTNPGTLRLGGRRSRMLLVLPPSCVPVVGWAHNTYCIAAGTCHCLAAAAAMIQSFIQGCKDQWNELVNLNKRQALTQGVNLGAGQLSAPACSCGSRGLTGLALLPGLVVTSALIIWKSLMLITGSESPVGAAAAAMQRTGPLQQCVAIYLGSGAWIQDGTAYTYCDVPIESNRRSQSAEAAASLCAAANGAPVQPRNGTVRSFHVIIKTSHRTLCCWIIPSIHSTAGHVRPKSHCLLPQQQQDSCHDHHLEAYPRADHTNPMRR
jgi:hypothetical protein